MKTPHFILLQFAVASLLVASVEAQKPTAPSATPAAADLSQLFNSAIAAFSAGDYKTTAGNLETVISQAGPDAQLESVYFTLGAAYFNLEQYPKAIETLKKFQQKYPKSPRFNEATFSIGQAGMLAKDYASAAAAFKLIENDPAYRDQALLFEGMALKESKKTNDAIVALERLIAPGIKNTNAANGAILLATLYSEKGQSDKSLALLKAVRQNVALVDNVARLNALATELGDTLL